MKIILTQDMPNLGQTGDVVDVADGYARNYLIPKEMAIKATSGAVKKFKHRQIAEENKQERVMSQAEALAERLSDITLTFEAKSSETGRLFGSVTTTDIAEALERETGEKFDRRKHILSDAIRDVGEHTVSVHLTTGVDVEVKAVVKPEDGELPQTSDEDAQEE